MKEIEEILPRKIEDGNLKKILNIYKNAIDKYVNVGTNIIAWTLHYKNGNNNTKFILAMILRRVVEIADAISILIEKSSVEPAKILLRTLLESTFYLEFILKDNTEKKITAFLLNEKWDERDFLKKLKSEQRIDVKQVEEEIRKIDKILESKENKEIMREYNRIRKKLKRKKIKWYMLFDGPQNIRELAIVIGRKELYDIFYREYSKTSHSSDVINGKFSLDEKNIPRVIQIRLPDDLKLVTSWTLRLLLLIYKTFVEKITPKKSYILKQWYNKEGKEMFNSVENTEITVIYKNG